MTSLHDITSQAAQYVLHWGIGQRRQWQPLVAEYMEESSKADFEEMCSTVLPFSRFLLYSSSPWEAEKVQAIGTIRGVTTEPIPWRVILYYGELREGHEYWQPGAGGRLLAEELSREKSLATQFGVERYLCRLVELLSEWGAPIEAFK